MKNLIKHLGIIAAIGLSINTYANTSEVDFPWASAGPFYCVASGGSDSDIITIDTANINLGGACSGPYVPRPGHLAMPKSLVNSYFFQTSQDHPRTGHVKITFNNGTVNCDIGTGGRQLWSQGGGYCMTPEDKAKG